MNVGTRIPRHAGHSMPEQDKVLPLGNATVTLQNVTARCFRVDTAILTPQGPRRVRLTFTGPAGSAIISLPRAVFWQLTSIFHERAAADDFGEAEQRGRRPRRRRP